VVALFVGAEKVSENLKKVDLVREMFSGIASRYDLINTVLSLGFDKRWRAQAVGVALEKSPSRILDVATGTGDFALALKRHDPRVEIVGVDLSEPMLALARRKAKSQGLGITWEQGNGTALSYQDASFEAVTISYGLRNFQDVPLGLGECFRLLSPGGRVVILEFTAPPSGFVGSLVRIYGRTVVPVVGGFLSGRRSAYEYLPSSIQEFLDPARLCLQMRLAGFADVQYWRQYPGISAVHVGVKPT
jgi:demethylmenaquinone methyltransferase/2-methoxy-6-polyprenyl-1,4-benzoquinol methylase